MKNKLFFVNVIKIYMYYFGLYKMMLFWNYLDYCNSWLCIFMEIFLKNVYIFIYNVYIKNIIL